MSIRDRGVIVETEGKDTFGCAITEAILDVDDGSFVNANDVMLTKDLATLTDYD